MDPADFDVGRDGAIAMIGEEPNRPSEVHYLASAEAAPKRLTDQNHELAALETGKVETITWQGPDGFTENGVIVYPTGYAVGRKYPLVLNIHGGPMGTSTEGWDPVNQSPSPTSRVGFSASELLAPIPAPPYRRASPSAMRSGMLASLEHLKASGGWAMRPRSPELRGAPMWRRLALTIGTLSLLTACASERPRPLDESEVRAFLGRYAEAWANYDFDYLRTATDSAWIGVQLSFPVTRDSAFALFRPLQEAGVTQRYVPSDARVRIMGDVAWVAWTLNGTYTAPATDAGRAALRALGSSEGGAREKFVETMVVYRSPAGLKVALHHVTPMSSEPLADAQAVK